MVLFVPLLMLLGVTNAASITKDLSPITGACFYNKNSRGCNSFMGYFTRNECCRHGGYFVRSADRGQLFLAIMINTYSVTNCENSCGIDYCEGKICKSGDKCIMRENDSICSSDCKCTRKQRESGPICVRNGPKYRNMCDLHLESCLTDTSHTLVPCSKSGCDRKRCGRRSCILNQNGKSECVDKVRSCVGEVYKPLCGVNNVTYPSLCHITKAGIERGREIYVAYEGTCRASATCSNVECPHSNMVCVKHHSNSSPVCLTCPESMEKCDNTKYNTDEHFCLSTNHHSRNTCYKDYLSCQNNVFVEVIHSGMCLHTVKLPLQNL
uniref:Follistatin n=1 Tax=Dendrocoelum lacteum TaxID=27895 RepID=T1DF95_9PLAT